MFSSTRKKIFHCLITSNGWTRLCSLTFRVLHLSQSLNSRKSYFETDHLEFWSRQTRQMRSEKKNKIMFKRFSRERAGDFSLRFCSWKLSKHKKNVIASANETLCILLLDTRLCPHNRRRPETIFSLNLLWSTCTKIQMKIIFSVEIFKQFFMLCLYKKIHCRLEKKNHLWKLLSVQRFADSSQGQEFPLKSSSVKCLEAQNNHKYIFEI